MVERQKLGSMFSLHYYIPLNKKSKGGFFFFLKKKRTRRQSRYYKAWSPFATIASQDLAGRLLFFSHHDIEEFSLQLFELLKSSV
jgi:hypothetical protein